MRKRIAVVSIVLTLVAAGAAIAATRTTGMGSYVTLHQTSLGKRIATGSGRTLYLFTGDGYKVTNCTGPCAQTWPPYKTQARPIAGMGVKQALLGRITRPNGSVQVTYNGHPLYRYSGDTAAGQTHGEGVDGAWYTINALGNQAAPRR